MALPIPKGVGSRRQAMLLGVLAVVLLLALVQWRPGGGAPSPKASSPSSSPASSAPRPGHTDSLSATSEESAAPRGRRPAVKEVSPDEVPMLTAEDFASRPSKEPADSGRNLFDLREPTRRPPPTPLPPPPPPGDVRFIGPLPPPPPTPTPRPPEIAFKFLGTFGPKSRPIAVIQQGDQVYNVREGDTLFDKFVVRKVGYESIDVGFVGFPSTETKRMAINP